MQHHQKPTRTSTDNRASKRISKCNYVSSYELHEDERTKATWVLCTRRPSVNVCGCVCVCLKFFFCFGTHLDDRSYDCIRLQRSYWEWRAPWEWEAEKFFSTLCCLWNFENKTTRNKKRENWVRAGIVCYMNRKKSDERTTREKWTLFGCNAVYKECIKKDYNFCLFTCTN